MLYFQVQPAPLRAVISPDDRNEDNSHFLLQLLEPPQLLPPQSPLPAGCSGGKCDFAKLFDNKREPLSL